MKKVFKQLQQNRGLSLVEILVSVAISMIVMVVAATFISNGSIFFKKQSGTIDVQNELMECSNKINDALLQTTNELEIAYTDSSDVNKGLKIYTGAYNSSDNEFTSGKGSARLIEWHGTADGSLYVMDVLEISDDNLKKGYLMGKHVSAITISISEECYEVQLDGSIRYKQPLIFNVSVTVTDKEDSRSDSRVITLRNELDKLTINGEKYTPNEDGLLTKN